MNYLDLINKCLVELNYKQVSAFSELTKNDHKKIQNILNVLSAEICTGDKWEFLLRQDVVNVTANTTKIPAPNGAIEKILVNGKPIKAEILNGELIIPAFDTDKEISITYYTRNIAVDKDGEEKAVLETADDTTLIPMPFAQPLLVYGTCMRLKGNPQHIRFNYWYSMYKEALANLRSKGSADANAAPSVKLFRQ